MARKRLIEKEIDRERENYGESLYLCIAEEPYETEDGVGAPAHQEHGYHADHLEKKSYFDFS